MFGEQTTFYRTICRQANLSLTNSCAGRLLDNSPTNQLAVSHCAEWSTHGLVNSSKFFKCRTYYKIIVH